MRNISKRKVFTNQGIQLDAWLYYDPATTMWHWNCCQGSGCNGTRSNAEEALKTYVTSLPDMKIPD